MAESLVIRTPARLHVGLLRPGMCCEGVRSGGLGLMVEHPATVVRITATPAARHRIEGIAVRRVHKAISLWQGTGAPWDLPGFDVCVEQTPPAHGGLGSGTQLALATVTGLAALFARPLPPVLMLAEQLGRARRSAVGSIGFRDGGLVYDPGGAAAEDRVEQMVLPDAWRFVVLVDRDRCGPSGDGERRLFAQLAPPDPQRVDELVSLAESDILPAVRRADFGRFADHLDRYGGLAGASYRAVASEPAAGGLAARRVAWMRRHGAPAAAQSSWGPAVFAPLPDAEQGRELIGRLTRDRGIDSVVRDVDMLLVKPAHRGAIIERSVPAGT